MAFGNNSRVTKAESSNQEQSNIQLSITAEKLNDINKSAKETVQSLNNVFSAVSGSSNFAKTFDDLTDGIQTAASALDALTKQTNNPDMALNNVASVQAQFDGLQSAYANINSKLSDLVKSTDTSAINDVDKVIHNIEKMEQSTSDVSKSLKKSLQKMAEESGNTAEIDSTLRTLENNFASVSDEIKSKFNELIQKQVQDIVSGMQDSADASLVMISNGRGLQNGFNRSITNTGNMAAGVYQNAVVAHQMNNAMPFWNRSDANFNGIANTASEMGVMQTKYEGASARVRDSYTNAEKEDDPEKRKQLIKEANEQYQNLVAIQKAMNVKAKELGKQLHLISPDDLKRLGDEGKQLNAQVKKILAETSANSGRIISLGAAFNVKDNEKVAESFAKDKAELDNVNKALDETQKKTESLAKTVKNELSSAFNTLMSPFKALGRFLPLLGAGGMLGFMNVLTKPLKYYSEKHKDMYTSMGTDAYAGVGDLGQSQANANSRLMLGNSLYAMSGGMIDRRAINNSYNSAMREVGGAYGASPEQGAADMNSLVKKTALMQNVWGIDQGTMNNAYQTFYKDMRMNASEAANAIARVAQTAQASGIPVGKYLNMISGLAHDFMKIGIDGDKAETVMSGLLGKGMRADVAQDIAGQSANAMGGFAQNYNMVGYAAAMQGMDPFHGLALASYSHEANGEARKGWAGDMSKMMDTMLNQYSMAYGDNPDVKRFGVTDTLKKQFGFSQRAASTLASSYLKGDTKQFEEMFEKEMDKKENPNGALEEVNKQLAGQFSKMTGQLAGSDKLRAQMDANLYGAADSLGARMDGIITKLGPLLMKAQDAMLELAKDLVDFVNKFLNSKIWNNFIGPAISSALTHPAAAIGTGLGVIGLNKLFKSIHLPGAAGKGAAKGGSTVLKGLIGPLSGLLKGTGRVAAVGALAYGGYKALTSDSGEGLGKTIGDFFTEGNVFDKIYDLISKIYDFIAGGVSNFFSGGLSHIFGGDKDSNGNTKSFFEKVKDDSTRGASFLGAAGLLGYLGKKHFGNRHKDNNSNNSNNDINDKLDNIANDTKDAKKETTKAKTAAQKEYEKAQRTHEQNKTRLKDLQKKAADNAKAGRKNSSKLLSKIAHNKSAVIASGLKLHSVQLKQMGKLGSFLGTMEKFLGKTFSGGIVKVFGKIASLWKGFKGSFGGIFKVLGPIGEWIGKIAKKIGIGGVIGTAVEMASGSLFHLAMGDSVDGDLANSVINNAIPAITSTIGAVIGTCVGPGAGTYIGMAGGAAAGSYLNDTETAKWMKNKAKDFFGASDEAVEQRRREQKSWAYDKNGDYDPLGLNSDNKSEDESGGGDGEPGTGLPDDQQNKVNEDINKFLEQANADSKKADEDAAKATADVAKEAGVSEDEANSVDSGNDSGSEDKQRKSDDSRMKASKDNSDKVVGQAKKEEKLSTTRNKQIQMFQNLHKQLMQMFQASVKEEHGNLWKKLDIMEHILFDINKNIISCGKILNKGLANRGGGGLNYDFTKDHGATAEQLNKKLTGALAGQGDLIIKLAKENGIDAAAIVAIACAESGGGANSTGNNFFGLMDSSHHLQSFSSVEEGIMAEIRTLKGFAAEGKTTLGAIQKEYCPDSEGGANWRKNVGGALTDMGMQVSYGGDSTNNGNYSIAGGDFDGMQEATKNFFYAVANAWKSAHPELAGLEFTSGKRNGDGSSHHDDGGAFDVDNGYFDNADLRAEYVALVDSMGGKGLDEWTGTYGHRFANGDNIHATAPGSGGRDGSYDGSGGGGGFGGGDVMPDVQWADQDTIDGYNQYQSMSTTESNNITGLDMSQYEITTDANGVEHQTLKQPGVVMANGKPVDRFTDATRKKIEENLAKGLAPNGEKYLQNDIDYLKAHGYTDMEEIKIALNLDKKYAMEADNPEFLKLMAEKPGWAKSSISVKSPFATGAYYYHHLNGMNAYWTNNNAVGADSNSIYATLLKQSGQKANIGDHIQGMKLARDQLMSSRKGFDAGIPASSYFDGAERSRGKTNVMPSNVTAAAGIQKAAEDAKKAADKAKASAASAASSSSAAGNIANTSSGLTNPATNQQDNSTLTNAGDNTKEESVIDVNINVDNAEEAFLRKFGELLKDAIEKTGARVTSLENHTSDIAKAADYLSASSAK
jgi:hypothetical protein